MTSTSKNMYIDKLDYIVNKYNNTYHRTIKMESVDVKPSVYIDFNKENNKEGPKFKVGDNVKISKYKNIYEKEFQKASKKEFRVEKEIKRKGGKLYVKWKGYDNSLNSWIDKKYIVYMNESFPKPKL